MVNKVIIGILVFLVVLTGSLGAYSYIRSCVDPPSVLYASPLRHNHEFYSFGVGATWLVKICE